MDAHATPLDALLAAFAGCRIVDLSATLENDAPIWPSHPPLIIHKTITHERHGYFTNTLFMCEHTGTHCDAPAHAVPAMADQTIDVMPIGQMIGPACVVDLRPLALEAGDEAGPDSILAWEAANGRIGHGEIVLINFGWHERHWTTDPAQSRFYVTNQPGLSEGAVRLIHERGAKALGSDNTNTEGAMKAGVMPSAPAHDRWFLPNGLPLIESLANLGRLPPRCLFIALPLKIKGGSGSPIRPVAVVAEPSA